jgi:photosystem II stability/assembly factor-like uncharacterized protein
MSYFLGGFMKSYTVVTIALLLLSSSSQALAEWVQTNGPYGGSVNTIAINERGHIFAGTSAGGVFRSTNNGDNWAPINNGLRETNIGALTINASGHIFAGTHQSFAADDSGVYRSTDDGNSWIRNNTGSWGDGTWCLAINSSGHIFAGGHDIGARRSTDNGEHWSSINSGLPELSFPAALAFNQSEHIFAATLGDGVFRSTNNGETWTFLTFAYGYTIAINSSGHIFTGSFNWVSRSTDNGNSWTRVLQLPNGMEVRALAINAIGHIFAGTYNQALGGYGVFRSTDNGENWTPINAGLTDLNILSLAINANGYLFAGTRQGGVFRSVGSSTSVGERVKEMPTTFVLEQNYPNPFNPSTKIRYSLPSQSLDKAEGRVGQPAIGLAGVGSLVTLKVYDVLGREVRTLVNEKLEAGSHEMTFDATGLASGIYFYRLVVGNFTETKKLVLLR